eukprot:116579-Pelagomonas_calceolata.AAC.6
MVKVRWLPPRLAASATGKSAMGKGGWLSPRLAASSLGLEPFGGVLASLLHWGPFQYAHGLWAGTDFHFYFFRWPVHGLGSR